MRPDITKAEDVQMSETAQLQKSDPMKKGMLEKNRYIPGAYQKQFSPQKVQEQN